jgi:hypothetical protein
MRIESLSRARANVARERVEALELSERLGALGDYKSEKDGILSLLSGEAEALLAGFSGLCTAKFAANIVTLGLDYCLLSVGARLKFGNAELEITRVGKSCYEDCAVLQSGEVCPLPNACAFARVVRGGRIRIDDEIKFLEP